MQQARNSNTAIPARVIREAGNNFVLASQQAPGAWKVALDFASYRTLLNAREIPKDNFTAAPNSEIIFGYKKRPEGEQPLPSVATTGLASPNQAARFEPLSGAPLKTNARYILVDFHKGAAISLDGMRLKNMIIVNANVEYEGGPIDIQNTLFVNCSLAISPSPKRTSLWRRS